MKHLMRDKVRVFAPPVIDGYGKKTQDVSRLYHGRFTYEDVMVSDGKGEIIQSNAHVDFSPEVPIQVGIRVEFENEAFEVVSNKKPKTEGSIHHQITYLKRIK